MDSKLMRDVRLLKAYAAGMTICLVVLLVTAFQSERNKKFDQIDAERINIVEPDGKVRLTLANHERMPGGQIAGVDLSARYGNRVTSNNGPATAGLIFFNDDGDECGGLVYGSKIVDGKPTAVVRLSFDHYRQNEAIDIAHGEQGGMSRSGLEIVDTGDPITEDEARQLNAILPMKDGPEKDAAMKKFGSEHAAKFKYAQRMFVGHLAENDASAVVLMDKESRPRIRMEVDASGAPSLQFLDEHGKDIYSLPRPSGDKDHSAH